MIGQNIGKYRVLDRIGRGGMGTVYRAIDETLHREVAVKVLNTELNDPSVARRFRAEAVTVARLNHPGIATVYELFQHEGQWLMVMEFVRGETLEALVVRKGAVPVEEAAELCMQALGALAHAHGLGVVHRDLKPANIMVAESASVKVMDFGIARVVGTEHLTSAGFMMGTPAYMAPEQVVGEDIDARADLYAMGVVLYHLVTGKLPFKGNTPFEMAQSRLRDQPTPVRTVRAELPEWLERVFEIALQREPARRFQSAPSFREALRRGLANLPLETPESTVIPPELIATAAPSSMPVPGVGPATMPAGTGPVRAEIPRAPAPAVEPVTVVAAPQPSAAAVEAARTRRPLWLAVAAGVVVVAGLAGWVALRSPGSGPPSAPAAADAGPAAPAPAAPADAPVPPPAGVDPAASAVAAPAAGNSAPVAPPTAAPADTSASAAPPSSPGTTPAPAGARSTGPAAPGATAPATTAGTAARGGARGRGRGAAAPDPLVEFENVRLLVVTGRRAEEQPGVLTFGDGRVSVVGQQNGAALSALPYGDITYAYYTRAKDPKWSPVLAAPPANVDLPSGLFSPARHWLTLQTRAQFLILRLEDATWRQVLETVTARTGVAVEHPGAGQ